MKTDPEFHNRENPIILSVDGKKCYHSRSVAVSMVLFMRHVDGVENVAIVKRGTKEGMDYPGLWCLPCGYLDWNESGSEAVFREVWEEIGLDLNKIEDTLKGKFLKNPWQVRSSPNDHRQNVTLVYGAKSVNTLQTLPILFPNHKGPKDEIADAKWIKVRDIKLYQFAFEHDKLIAEFANAT